MLTGEQKLRLCQEIAEGTKTYVVLAQEYGYKHGAHSIGAFKVRNQEIIDRYKHGFELRMDDLWIARKHDRIATYQETAERLSQLVEELDPEKQTSALKTLNHTLRSVAEELGHLQPKEVPVAGQLTVRLEGVSTEDLT